MNDGTPAPATETAEPAAVQEPTTEQAVEQQPTSQDYAKVRNEARREREAREKAEAKLAKFEESTRTEEETKLAAAKAEGRKEVEDKVAAMELDHALERELLKRQMDPDLKHLVTGKVKIESADDVAAAIDEALGEKEWAKPRANGSQGPPARTGAKDEYPRGGQWDRDQVAEVRATGQWAKYKDSITEWAKGR